MSQKKFYKLFKKQHKYVYDLSGKCEWRSVWAGPWRNCPESWNIRAGETLTDTEILDTNTNTECSSGIHFANNQWIRNFFTSDYDRCLKTRVYSDGYVVYEVKVLGQLVNPVYNTTTKIKKFRTDKLKLVRRLTNKQVRQRFRISKIREE